MWEFQEMLECLEKHKLQWSYSCPRQAFLEFPINKINMHKEVQARQLCAQTCGGRLSTTGN